MKIRKKSKNKKDKLS